VRAPLRGVLVGLGVVCLLAASAGGWWLARRPKLPPPPTAEELEALVARRAELQRELDELIRQDDQGLAKAPPAGILIGMPTRLTRTVVTQVVTGLFGETVLHLKNIKARVSKDVRAKMVLKKRTVGHIDLEVDLHEIEAVLKPGPPELTFGGNRIALKLPVTADGGHATATLHAKWDSKGLANVVCGDVEVHPEVSGGVYRTHYLIEGAFAFATEGERIVLRPDFGELEIRVFPRASEESWKVVEQVVAERNAVCKAALSSLDLRKLLEGVLDKGINVKIPKKIFKPIRLPAGVEKSLELQGVRLTLQVVPTGLVITPDRMWYGAEVRARAGRASAGEVPPPPPPPAPPSPPGGP
jgi:hypothetical protein